MREKKELNQYSWPWQSPLPSSGIQLILLVFRACEVVTPQARNILQQLLGTARTWLSLQLSWHGDKCGSTNPRVQEGPNVK